MRANSTLTPCQREAAIAWFAQGMADRSVATTLGVPRGPIRRLHERWRIHGPGALVAKQAKKSYSFALKVEAVRRFLAGEPRTEPASELGLSSPKQLETWARVYRDQGEDALRPKQRGRPPNTAVPAEETELERLRRENEFLCAQNAYLGKLRTLREDGHG
ncbi:helix-turn-helix domain-containing protein [Nocardiopsis aegyptia]|uniref:Transposase-like protein n=1 Tax=Nocardiopsis aegyptia TaxID=220378 RepID=A0A7Z0ELN4_9ACTN|nr:helix-turn-helix domain-containing protein [Nocardiopsis aegyptia]NYJ33550.1 transposase-like protein [Nocardiopsis aegyptia]